MHRSRGDTLTAGCHVITMDKVGMLTTRIMWRQCVIWPQCYAELFSISSDPGAKWEGASKNLNTINYKT